MEAVAKTAAETFEHIIRHQDVPELVPFLLQLPQKDVVAVRQRTLALKKHLEEYREQDMGPGKPNWGRLATEAQSEMLFLAGLATYSRKEALSRNLETRWTSKWSSSADLTGDLAPALAVLTHTRPDWLTDWMLRPLIGPMNAPSYAVLRELENRELLAHSPQLAARSLGWMLHEYNVYLRNSEGRKIDATHREAEILARIRADATLLRRDVPLLFDFDTEISSAATRSGAQQERRVSWLELLPQLVASGHLERGDLLTRSLLALRRDFRRVLLLWFKDLFLALEPTPAECLARQAELVELLAHPLPLVVNFALDQLKSLWDRPGFAPAPLLQHAEALMARQDLKTGLRTLLGGFEKLLKQDPALAPALAPLATAALANADTAVQERAAKLLASLLGAKKPLLTADEATAATAALGPYADVLAPAARALLAPYLGATAAAPAAEAATYAPLVDFVPDLSAATAIAPVADWHELLFLTGAVLKHEDSSALERWVDGLLRLQARFPADYLASLRPYLKQAFGSLAPDPKQATVRFTGGEFGPGYTGLEQGLLAGWASGFAKPLLENVTCYDDIAPPDPLVWVERWRLRFAEELLRERRGLPLLSTPTHAPHWVAPAALVEKLLAYEAAGQAPHPADLAVALARTAHAHPSAATARAGLPRLQHEGLRTLLDWFLGAAVVGPADMALPAAAAGRKPLLAQDYSEWREQALPPAATTVAETLPWLWAVAARTKQPAAGFPALAGPTGPPYAGGVRPWQPRWEVREQSHTRVAAWKWKPPEPGITTRWAELHILDAPTPGDKPSQLLLYSQHAGQVLPPQYWSGLLPLARDYPFLAGLLPQHPAPLHWHTLRLTATRDTAYAPIAAVLGQALRSLLGPGAAFEEPATLLLAVGLINNAATCRALATEALLSAVDHGRLLPATLGGALGQLLAAGYAPVQRLAEALAQARGLDPRTDDALRQLLEALLPALPAAAPLRNTRLLLDAYAAVRTRSLHPVPAPVQAQLRAWATVSSLKAVLKGLLD